ncbi:MAG TPA: GntR family transcriptional regulator [Amycolatopsis sp.]|nr:GntR family transcriptional regulator [Amycolatopsis sp.]
MDHFPLRVPKTAEVLAGRIRAQVVRGELVEGESMPSEQELMAHYGVSRNVLRETYRILESEGLITVKRGTHGGARVLAPDPRVAARHVGLLLQLRHTTLTDIERARIAIEPACVRWLAESPDLEDCLGVLGEQNKKAADVVDSPRLFNNEAFEFHRKIVQLAGNQTLDVMMSLVSDIIEQHLAARMPLTEHDQIESRRNAELSIRANEKLCRLLETAKPERAEQFWRQHVTAVVGQFGDVSGPSTVVDLLN